MGSKKKTTNIQTTSTHTQLIKLSYLQTLGVSQGLLDPKSFETNAETNVPVSSSSKEKPNFILPAVFGISKGKTSKSTNFSTTGLKLKEQYLQPYFDKIRYTIGIKELLVARYTFNETSEFVSTPFLSPKEIIKVYINVDEYIPPQFDRNVSWIKYYIKSEGSDVWVQVNSINAPTRFDSTGEIIPKIINFNIPKPTVIATEQKYNYTENPIKQFRFKAVLSRPTGGDNSSITPLLKSYRLIMIPRDN